MIGSEEKTTITRIARNFGATAAHDVHLAIDPWPRRSIDQERQQDASPAGAEEGTPDQAEPDDGYVWLPDRIPVLVPGQEWRTLWDTGRRLNTDLPDHHDARITFRDSQGEPYCTEAALDWRIIKDRDMVTVYRRARGSQGTA